MFSYKQAKQYIRYGFQQYHNGAINEESLNYGIMLAYGGAEMNKEWHIRKCHLLDGDWYVVYHWDWHDEENGDGTYRCVCSYYPYEKFKTKKQAQKYIHRKKSRRK